MCALRCVRKVNVKIGEVRNVNVKIGEVRNVFKAMQRRLVNMKAK